MDYSPFLIIHYKELLMDSIFFSFAYDIDLKAPHRPFKWDDPAGPPASGTETDGPTAENPYRACALYLEEDTFSSRYLYGVGNFKSRHPAKMRIVVHRDYKVKAGQPVKVPVLDAAVDECMRRLDYVERTFRLPKHVPIPEIYCGIFLKRYRRKYSCSLIIRILNWEPVV